MSSFQNIKSTHTSGSAFVHSFEQVTKKNFEMELRNFRMFFDGQGKYTSNLVTS